MHPLKVVLIAVLSLWSTVAFAHSGRVAHRAAGGPRVVISASFAPLVVVATGWHMAPHTGMVWIDGHYARHGHWIAGHWMPRAALR